MELAIVEMLSIYRYALFNLFSVLSMGLAISRNIDYMRVDGTGPAAQSTS